MNTLTTKTPLARLKSYIDERSLSERAFSKLCWVNTSTINAILAGKRWASAEVALKIQNITWIQAENLMLEWSSKQIKDQINQALEEN